MSTPEEILAKHLITIPSRRGEPVYYAPVYARVAAFRAAHPDGAIAVDFIQVDGRLVARAQVTVDGAVRATAHATVVDGAGKTWAGRELEKAETAAVGRALAYVGFGTVNAGGDLDEADHLADAPLQASQASGAGGVAAVSYVDVAANADGRPYLVAEGGLLAFSRQPFAEAGLDVAGWTTPGDRHLLPRPVAVTWQTDAHGRQVVKRVERLNPDADPPQQEGGAL